MNYTKPISCVLALVLSAGLVVGSTAKPAAKPSAKTPSQSDPLNLSVSGTAGQVFQPDPKLPGKYLWRMDIKSASGMGRDNGFAGTLHGVTAYLYQHGVQSAVMTAPTANGNSKSLVIVATGPGRVKVRSLTEAGTTLEADKMTWYAKTNKIIAIGNVVYQKGKDGPVMHVPHDAVTADTKLKAVSFGQGTASLP